MANKKGRFKPGDPNAAVRSRRHCYDCYLKGPVDRQGYTSCVLRPKLIPESVTEDQKLVLPTDLRWPERDHANAHEMIDAVLDRDIAQMEAWIQLYGDHFGYEDYLVWCREQLRGEEDHVVDRPIGAPVNRDRIARIDGDGDYLIDFHVLRYANGDAWGQATVWRPGRGAGTLLTRYLIELRTGHEIVEEHHPGRWAALGYPSMTGMGVVRRHRRRLRPRRPLSAQTA